MAKCVRCGASGLTLKVDSDGMCPACRDHLKAAIAERLSRLEEFYEKYKLIPDAEAKAQELLEGAETRAADILAKAQGEADTLVTEAREYSEKIRREAEVTADTVKRNSEDMQKAAEYTSSVVIAELNERIAALLKDAANDFHFKARATVASQYLKERKNETPVIYEDAVAFNALTPSAFRKRAKQKGFIAFDFETTGLKRRSDKIIEIGAIKYENGEEVDRFQTLVNPGIHIPDEASKINNIYDDMVADAPSINDVLPEFLNFIGDKPLVAHNAEFDIGFLEHALTKAKYKISIEYGDSLQMSRKAYPDLVNHKLGTVAAHLGIRIVEQHRAIGDCEALGCIVLDCCER